MARLADGARLALGEISGQVGGVRLARTVLIDQARESLESAPVLNLMGAPGVGKSSVLKHLAELVQPEGQIIVLRNGRIIPGGWLRMSHELGCTVSSDRFFNELGAGGGAILFVDNIDQIDDVNERATVTDLLGAVARYPGWRAIVTSNEAASDWKSFLPPVLMKAMVSLGVPAISDDEAAQLSELNATLAGLLDKDHPAKSVARNLFFLSRMVTLGAGQQAEISTEIDLARLWWDSGGGRGDAGRLARLKTLRAMGTDILAHPIHIASQTDALDSEVVAELLRLDAIREEIRGAEVAFRHDVLRDWTIGFMIDEDSRRLSALPKDAALPATLSRGLEMAARVALGHDNAGARWQNLLRLVSGEEVHGSWRRPVLLALPRSEHFVQYLQSLQTVLLADDASLLREIVRLIIVVESEPADDFFARLQPPQPVPPGGAGFVFPKGRSWSPLIAWLAVNARNLPQPVIPEVTNAFKTWLLATQAFRFPVNAEIVAILFEWLALIDEAVRPRMFREGDDLPPLASIPHITDAHDVVRMTACAFALVNPAAAQKYLTTLNAGETKHREFETVLKGRGALAKAAPAAFVDFFLGGVIEKPTRRDPFSSPRDYRPFGIHEHLLMPASPSQGPFLEILETAPDEGLRLARHIVEHATDWRRKQYAKERVPFPRITIAFPEGSKSFEGDASVYRWSRISIQSDMTTSALMALEAWGHSRIEAGAAPRQVLDDIFGPDGASFAFLAVAIDLVLSHWSIFRDVAWPLAAASEVLKLDEDRHVRDVTGVDRLLAFEREQAGAKVKRADLDARPSRNSRLLNGFPYYAFHAEPKLAEAFRKSLEQANNEIFQRPIDEDEDPIQGLHALAKRALRMSDPSNWQSINHVKDDGSTIELLKYLADVDEQHLIAGKTAEVLASSRHANARASIEMALTDPTRSTPDVVADGIAWAKQQPEDPVPAAGSTDRDEFDMEWDRRAVVMAASLAVRDYRGDDRAEILVWAEEILDLAVAGPARESHGNNQIVYDKVAIAALGFIALYREDPADVRDRLLRLAANPSLPVTNALGSGFVEWKTGRLLPAVIRTMLASSSYPRRRDVGSDMQAIEQAHAQRIENAIGAERAWLSGQGTEPEWPTMPAWITRPKRRLRLPGSSAPEVQERGAAPPDAYAHEQRMGEIVSHFVPLTVGTLPTWLEPLTEHLMAWTLAANASADDDHEVEGRPFTWNAQFYDYLGILCAALPHEQVLKSFVLPITELGDEPFHDGMASLLRGFDRAIMAKDTTKPAYPAAMRVALAKRLRSTRNYRRLGREKQFTTESHAADALTAMYFQRAGILPSRRPSIPDNWAGLDAVMPTLTGLVTGAASSGYLAALFLEVIETSPRPALLPYLTEVFGTWCSAYGPDTSFWVGHGIGGRVCRWLKQVLLDGAMGPYDPIQERTLLASLDILIQAGVTAAREIEDALMARDPVDDTSPVSKYSSS